MKSRKSFLLRISPSLYAEIEAWAQQDLRSVNAQIEFLLKEAVSKRRRQLTGPSGPAESGRQPPAD